MLQGKIPVSLIPIHPFPGLSWMLDAFSVRDSPTSLDTILESSLVARFILTSQPMGLDKNQYSLLGKNVKSKSPQNTS